VRSGDPPFVHYDGAWKGHRSSLHFVHIERVSTRKRKYNWELSPHRHRDLHQFLICQSGSGEVAFDLQKGTFAAPTVISMPPLIVHQFAFAAQSKGYLLTIADSYLKELLPLVHAPHASDVLQHPLVLDMNPHARLWGQIESAIKPLNEYVGHEFRGSSAVIVANILMVLEGVIRHPASSQPADRDPGSQRARQLYDRFRALIETNFIKQWPVSAYAQALAVTERTLHRACDAVAGAPPLKIIHRRSIIEAQRRLLYSPASVSEVGFSLGFQDPAHFSRFFSENVGESPLAFRRSRLG